MVAIAEPVSRTQTKRQQTIVCNDSNTTAIPLTRDNSRAHEAVTHPHNPTRDRAARLILLALLDSPCGLSPQQLQERFGDLPRASFEAGLETLLEAEVLISSDGILRSSPAVTAVDRLGLIAL
jgi:hypothetical protein